MKLPAEIVRRTLLVGVLIAAGTGLVPLSARGSAESTRQQNGISPAVWMTRAAEHFDIYCRRQQEGNLAEVAREAEGAYSRVSFDLKHELAARVPLILVQTDRDLPQNTPQAREIVRASGAPNRDHLLLALEPLNGRAAVLAHQLTHVFEFEMVPSSSPVPAWVLEGLSDHETGTWASSDFFKVRDAAAAGMIPGVASLVASDRLWGHAVFDFIAAEYGTQGIRRYLIALRDSSATGDDSARVAFGIAASDFDRVFQMCVRTRFNNRREHNGGRRVARCRCPAAMNRPSLRDFSRGVAAHRERFALGSSKARML